MPDKINNVASDMRFGCTGDSYRLVECNIDMFLLLANRSTIDPNFIPRTNNTSKPRNLAIDRNTLRFYPLVRFPSGANPVSLINLLILILGKFPSMP